MTTHGSITCLVAFGIALLAPHAGAQENLEEASQPDSLSEEVVSQFTVPSDHKSEFTALLSSLLCTAVPITVGVMSGGESQSVALLAFSGYLIGPAAGHFYAGRPGRAWLGIGLRTLAVGGLVAAYAMSMSSGSYYSEDGETLGYVSLGAAAVFVIVDIVSAPLSARTYNEANGTPRAAMGVYVPDGGDGVGATVQVTF